MALPRPPPASIVRTMGVASSRPRLDLPPGPWTLTLTTAEGTVGRLRAWEAVEE